MKKLAAVGILALVFLAAGCLQPKGKKGPAGKAISMTQFEVKPKEVPSGQSVTAVLKVKNTGALTATDLQAKLSGIAGISNPLKPAREGYELLPPPKGKATGEMRIFDWEVDAPSVPTGLESTARVTARTTFKYKTFGLATIPLLSKSYRHALLMREKELPKPGSTKITKGPLDVEITTLGRTPAVDSGDRKFLIEVKISNIGRGIVVNQSKLPLTSGEKITSDDFDKLKILIQPMEGIEKYGKCPAYNTEKGTSLRRTGSTIYNCRLNATKIPDKRRDLNVRVKLTYGYLIEKSAAFTVKGKPAGV